MNYPTKESVELGLRLCALDIVAENQNPLECAIEEAQAVQQQFYPVEKFAALCQGIHDQMCHSPMAHSCSMQCQLLYAIMAKMFIAGWSVGRQEVIDDELKRMR